MSKLTVYGASDDLIEVEGDLTGEWCTDADGEGRVLAFSDGTVLALTYGGEDAAFWRIHKIATGTASYSKVEGTDEHDDYSDRVTLTGDIRWVVCAAYRDLFKLKSPERGS